MNGLFTYETCSMAFENDAYVWKRFVFHDCVLTSRIGAYDPGQHFNQIVIDYLEETVTLYLQDHTETFKVKVVIDESA